ncbi:MAG: hypothetical protein DCC67_15260 [Planctomycetota bacterium]|nr:MAG: hypothetical protein DCC67_15260 [Planctomycetota bacterium]
MAAIVNTVTPGGFSTPITDIARRKQNVPANIVEGFSMPRRCVPAAAIWRELAGCTAIAAAPRAAEPMQVTELVTAQPPLDRIASAPLRPIVNRRLERFTQ